MTYNCSIGIRVIPAFCANLTCFSTPFMPKIYDNIENHLTKGLNETLELSERTDFCVGYFNLRGWKEVAEKIDLLPGATLTEGEEQVHRYCRLLVGMQKMPLDILRDHF